MNTSNQATTQFAQQPADADSHGIHRSNGDFTMSVYAILLCAPLTTIASNVSDRSDISSAAILGYN